MPQFKTSKEVYASCEYEGYFIKQEEVDVVKIRHMVGIALGDRHAAQTLLASAVKQDGAWNAIYKLYYDALHQLAEALLRFDKIKTGKVAMRNQLLSAPYNCSQFFKAKSVTICFHINQ